MQKMETTKFLKSMEVTRHEEVIKWLSKMTSTRLLFARDVVIV